MRSIPPLFIIPLFLIHLVAQEFIIIVLTYIIQNTQSIGRVMRALNTDQWGEKNEEIYQKTSRFRKQIRSRQKQTMFNMIRKQYHQMYESQRQKNSQQGCSQTFQQYLLISTTLQKYHHLSHAQISTHLEQIAQHLLEFNLYLTEFQKQSLQDQMSGQCFNDEQSLLVHDLFYLTMEHQGRFKFPRKFKFIRDGSNLVASYVSIVSAQISPEELAYWIDFMGDQDRNILYLNILGQDQDMCQLQIHAHSLKNLHYQTWVNHPILRAHLLQDLPRLQSAGKAVRQIVGFRRVHPDRLKNSKGESLYEILCNMFEDELEGMIEISSASKNSKIQKCKLTAQHLQICVRVLEAKYLSDDQPIQLYELLNRILSNRVQSHILQISPLFCAWVVDALLNHQLYLLSDVGYQILINILQYDPDAYTTGNKLSTTKIKKQKLHLFYEMVASKYPHLAEKELKYANDDVQAGGENECDQESEQDGHQMEEEKT